MNPFSPSGRLRAALSLLLAIAADSSGAMPSTAPSGPGAAHFADADDPALVAAGREVYRAHCANCHGRRLEGQALWQIHDANFHRRAPAHNDSGHTWQHADEELFRITRSGRPSGMPRDAQSYMPAFAGVLSDQEILATLAFIKARWSMGIRAAQASLNPDFRGMPKNADTATWTLPPNCSSQLQEWRNATP